MNERKSLTEQCAESETLRAELLNLQTKFGILSVARNDANILKESLKTLSNGILNQSNALYQDFMNYRQIAKELFEVIVNLAFF